MTYTIVKVDITKPYNNYANVFGDPTNEQTVQIHTEYGLVLFYRTPGGENCLVSARRIMNNVTIFIYYNSNVEDLIDETLSKLLIMVLGQCCLDKLDQFIMQHLVRSPVVT